MQRNTDLETQTNTGLVKLHPIGYAMKMPTAGVATNIKRWIEDFKNTSRKTSTEKRTEYVLYYLFKKKSSFNNDDFINQTKHTDINKKNRKAHSNTNIQPKITYRDRLKKIIERKFKKSSKHAYF